MKRHKCKFEIPKMKPVKPMKPCLCSDWCNSRPPRKKQSRGGDSLNKQVGTTLGAIPSPHLPVTLPQIPPPSPQTPSVFPTAGSHLLSCISL